MYNLEAIKKYNGTTAADIEGGSFIIRDGVRVPITGGQVEAQIDGLPVEATTEQSETSRIIAEIGATVYAVFTTIDYEGSYLEGLYSTREAVNAAIVRIDADPQYRFIDSRNIEEWKIQ